MTPKKAQTKSKADDLSFHLFFKNHPIPMWVYDLDTLAFLQVNDAAIEKYGYTQAEFEKLTIKDIRPAEDVPLLMEKIKEIRSKHQYFGRWRHQLKGGRIIYAEISVYANEFEGRSSVFVMAQDVTEHKLAEEALQESESRYRDLVENSYDLICTHDLEGNLLSVNNAAVNLTGYSRSDLLKMNLKDALTPDSQKGFEYYLKRIQTKGHAHGEMQVVTAQGEIRIWEYDNSLRTQGVEKPLVRGMAHDITARHLAEDELAKSEERYRSISEDMPAMICRFKHDGTLTFINSFYCQYFNMRYEDLIGSNLFELIAEEEREAVRNNYLSLNQEKPYITYEYKTRNPDGRISWQRWTDRALFDEQGNIVEFQSLGEDITESKQAEMFAQSTIDALAAHICVLDESGQILSVNRTWREFADANPPGPKNYAIGMNYLKVSEEAAKSQAVGALEFSKNLREVLNGKRNTFTLEYPCHSPNEKRWFISRVTKFEDNGTFRVVIAHENITTQKVFEGILRTSEERFSNAFENAPIGMALVELNGRMIKVNRALCNLLGYSEDELIHLDFQTITHPDDLKTDLQNVQQILAGKIQTYQMEKRYQHKLGQHIWTSLSVSLVKDDDGAPLYFVSQVKDITENKRSEAEISRQLSELETLYESGLALSRLHTPKEIAQKTIEILERKMNWHHIAIRQYDSETDSVELIAFNRPGIKTSEAEEQIKSIGQIINSPNQGLSGWVTKHGEPIRVPDVKTDPRYAEVFPGIQSGLYVPILFNGRVTGSIAVESEIKNAFTEQDERLLVTLTGQAAISIENARLYTIAQQELQDRQQAEVNLQQQTNELTHLLNAGRELSNTLELKQIYSVLYQHISTWLPCDQLIISSYNPHDKIIRCEYIRTEEGPQDVSTIPPIPLDSEGSGTQSMVIQSGQSLLLADYQHQPTKAKNASLVNEKGLIFKGEEQARSAILVPLIINGEVSGVLQVFHHTNNIFTEAHLRFVEALAFRVSGAMTNANLFQQLQQELMERRLIEEEIRLLNADLEKHVEERTAEIEATKKRLELATRAAGLGIWEWDLQTDILMWDAQMYKIYGVPPGQFDQKIQTFMNFVHPEDQQDLIQIAQAILKKEEHYQTEYRIQRKDGTVRHIAVQGLAIYSDQNEAEKIIGTVRDITDQKQAEQALRESGEYARLLFDAAPDPVSVAKTDGIMVDVNKLFEEQHRVNREEIRGKHIAELNIFPAEDARKAGDYISAIMRGQKMPPVELNFYTPDDGVHTLEMHSYPIEVNGTPLVLSTSRDITLHKKAEETLLLANAEKARALRMKDEFLASMSHELRTPLNAILGISESLEEQVVGELNHKQLKYLKTINESGKHLLELINDILDLSKIEAGRLEINILDIEVRHLCDSSLRMVRELAQKKNIDITFSMDTSVRIIQGDERRLKQALVNLLSNAVKFTPAGGKIGLQVKGVQETDTVSFTVSDNGIGIKKENIERLFKPFVQLDSSLAREYSGTGLGLALVSQMVRLHGGTVDVISEPNVGSQFTITLPWKQKEVQTRQNIKAQRRAEESGSKPQVNEKRNGKILLVEDTESVELMISDYLKFLGYEVVSARNGLLAVSMAETEKPNIILMDVMMPGLDGLEATKRIRANESLQHVPIIALTALAMPGDREQCLAAGMNEYLSKPILMQDLARVLEKYIKIFP